MEFQRVVNKRRMVRSFEDRAVPGAVLDRILANAHQAPSAGFSQGYAFLALRERADRERFWEVAGHGKGDEAYEDVARAPVLVVPLACKRAYLDRYAQPDKGWTDRQEARWPVPYWYIDTGFTALLMLLTAVDAGLGALFFGIPPENIPAFRAAFGVPDDHDPIGAVAIGYASPGERPSGSPLKRRRRPIDDVVHHGRW